MEEQMRIRRGGRYQAGDLFWSSSEGQSAVAFNNDGFGASKCTTGYYAVIPPKPPRVARQGEASRSTMNYEAGIPPNLTRRYQPARPGLQVKKTSAYLGKAHGLAARTMVIALLSLLTLGLYAPWGICALWRWDADNTMISGYVERFYGTGEELLSRWLLWTLPIYIAALVLLIATVFTPESMVSVYTVTAAFMLIYSFWLRVSLLRWRMERTSLG